MGKDQERQVILTDNRKQQDRETLPPLKDLRKGKGAIEIGESADRRGKWGTPRGA